MGRKESRAKGDPHESPTRVLCRRAEGTLALMGMPWRGAIIEGLKLLLRK